MSNKQEFLKRRGQEVYVRARRLICGKVVPLVAFKETVLPEGAKLIGEFDYKDGMFYKVELFEGEKHE